MPSRRKKKTFEQSQDASWVVETYCRLENVAAQLQEDDSAYPSSQAWMRAGTQDLEALRSGRPWSAASSSSGAHRTGEETSDLLYRATDEGLFATGFNPWRNTWYVTGRPVQVHEKVLDKWLSVKLPLLQGDERCSLVSNIVDEFTALEIDDIVRMQEPIAHSDKVLLEKAKAEIAECELHSWVCRQNVEKGLAPTVGALIQQWDGKVRK